MLKRSLSLVGLALLASSSIAAQVFPPAIDIVEGACPFECCTYGRWRAGRSVDLRSAPDSASAVVGRVEDGETVAAETGRVHTVPTPFRVGRAMALGTPAGTLTVQPGDTIWLLDYRGEGLFNAWVDGRRTMASLDFSTFGGSSNSRLGELLGELDSVWWVRIRTDSGTTGWTPETDAFGGKDACAC